MKTIFLISGFDTNETAAGKDYRWLVEGLKRNNYNVISVDIKWRRKTPSQYVKEFKTFYKNHKTKENIIIGNSFGAVVAFLSASELSPDSIYLCSLSPFFEEDKGKFPDKYAIRHFGKRRAEDLWSYSASKVAEKINKTNVETFVLYGQKEHKTSPNLVARAKDTAKKLKNSELIEVPNAPHNLEDKTYGSALIKML